MNIFLDNIIFSLQESGGISVVWYELLKRIVKDTEFNPLFIDTPGRNLFRMNLTINQDSLLENPYRKYPINLQRFLNPGFIRGKGLFHSSYYRVGKGPELMNITTVHDFTYEHFRKGISKRVHHQQKDFAIQNSKRIICVSQHTQAELLKYYPGINPDQVKVIYHGVSSDYTPLPEENKSGLNNIVGFDSGEFVLFVGGRRFAYENYIPVVKACNLLQLPLVLVGGGFLSRTENSFLCANLGYDRFKVLQGISNEQLNTLYNNALCLVYPSISEGFGLPVLEAQRAGCPVISTVYSSIPEVAGKGAILLNEISGRSIADAISIIRHGGSFVSELRDNGFRNAQYFSWDKCYQETKQLYKEVY
ncbi:MAG: glycosyltransferase family 1 protein, partial [Bacteroidia bacterium]|nr:glycosyltransferase family 1 protein [Bacteroidia bacterium]